MQYSCPFSIMPSGFIGLSCFRSILYTAVVIFLLVGTVSAAEHTLNPGDSIQQNISDAADGDTIVLNPGIYFEHDLVINKNLTIRAVQKPEAVQQIRLSMQNMPAGSLFWKRIVSSPSIT